MKAADYINLALLLVTSAYLFFTIRIWLAALASNKLTRDALTLQQRTFAASVRPAIHVTSVTVKPLDGAAGRLSPVIASLTNNGGSAFSYRAGVAVDLRTTPPSQADWPAITLGAAVRRLAGASWEMVAPVTEWSQWRDAFIAGQARLYFFHLAEYDDASRRQFRIRTVHELRGLQGNPVWPVVFDVEVELNPPEQAVSYGPN